MRQIDGTPAFSGFVCLLNQICHLISKIVTPASPAQTWLNSTRTLSDSAKTSSDQKCDFLCKLGEKISSSDGQDAEFFLTLMKKCVKFQEGCSHDVGSPLNMGFLSGWKNKYLQP